MKLDEAIEKRHSVRKFSSIKKVNYRKVIDAIDAANKAPLAGNLPTLRFILIQDKARIGELAEAAQQDFIIKSDFVVAVCSNKKYLEKYYYERAERYAKQQAGAAIQNFLLKITDMKLACCWIGAFSDDSVRRVLKIPEEVEIEALLPVGYESGRVKQRRRPLLDKSLFYETYGSEFMKPKVTPEV